MGKGVPLGGKINGAFLPLDLEMRFVPEQSQLVDPLAKRGDLGTVFP